MLLNYQALAVQTTKAQSQNKIMLKRRKCEKNYMLILKETETFFV